MNASSTSRSESLCTAGGPAPNRARVTVYKYICPYCENGRWPDGETCLECNGYGLVTNAPGYVATAMTDSGIPLGAMVCAGWWALATGKPLPQRGFRDPGGSDRCGDAPAQLAQACAAPVPEQEK